MKHNQHKDYYQPLEQYIKENDIFDLLTPEDYAECLRTDCLWTLQWYPDNPVGFYIVAGPTLERVLELASNCT